MTGGMLDQVRAVDPVELAAIVCQDQRDSTFTILDWSVKPLNSKGVMNPEGLWLYYGRGYCISGAEREWAVVLKRITDLSIPPDVHSIWYETRDGLMYESGLLGTLPGPVAAPRFYGLWKRADAWWIWMEYIVENAPPRWTMEEYATAARAFGQFNGAYVLGKPLPSHPWLCREHPRFWYEGADSVMDWNSPYVHKYISPAFRQSFDRLKLERKRFLSSLYRLPQVFSHFDTHRRNLIIRKDENGDNQVVAFDWPMAGTGPVGGELYSFVGGNAFVFEVGFQELPELEAVALEGYAAGLRDCGAQVEPEIIRLGYLLWSVLWWINGVPTAISFWTKAEFQEAARTIYGQDPDNLCVGWVGLAEFYLEREDEVRYLLNRHGW